MQAIRWCGRARVNTGRQIRATSYKPAWDGAPWNSTANRYVRLDTLEPKRAVRALYKDILNSIEFVKGLLMVEKSTPEMRNAIRGRFEENAHITDPRIIRTMVLFGVQHLDAIYNNHVWYAEVGYWFEDFRRDHLRKELEAARDPSEPMPQRMKLLTRDVQARVTRRNKMLLKKDIDVQTAALLQKYESMNDDEVEQRRNLFLQALPDMVKDVLQRDILGTTVSIIDDATAATSMQAAYRTQVQCPVDSRPESPLYNEQRLADEFAVFLEKAGWQDLQTVTPNTLTGERLRNVHQNTVANGVNAAIYLSTAFDELMQDSSRNRALVGPAELLNMKEGESIPCRSQAEAEHPLTSQGMHEHTLPLLEQLNAAGYIPQKWNDLGIQYLWNMLGTFTPLDQFITKEILRRKDLLLRIELQVIRSMLEKWQHYGAFQRLRKHISDGGKDAKSSDYNIPFVNGNLPALLQQKDPLLALDDLALTEVSKWVNSQDWSKHTVPSLVEEFDDAGQHVAF